MSSPVSDAPAQAGGSPWVRLHRALMPDYNRKATAYWLVVCALGWSAVALSVHELRDLPMAGWWQIAAAVTMTMLTGLVSVRIPRSPNSFTAGEFFIFLLMLLHGPAAATLAAAAEAGVGSWRSSKRWSSRIVSPAMSSLAMYAAGSLLQAGFELLRDYGLANDGVLLFGTILFALGYFIINTMLVTLLPSLKRNEWAGLRQVIQQFGWLGVVYVASASVAVFIYLSYRQSGFVVVLGALPIIAILLTTGHYYFRHQEAAETAAKAKASAALREAEQAALHLQELELSQRRFHSAFTHASIGMALVAFDGGVRQVNLALCQLLGIDPDAPTYPSFADFVSTEHRGLLANALARVHAGQGEAPAIELRCRHRDGAEVWVAVNCSFFAEMGSSSAACFILQVQDITGRRRAEAELHHIAFHDSLTGLPNRVRFHDHLARAIERSKADPSHQFAVMFLDFDRFKLINDSMGHTIGDEFLVQASRRLANAVRPGDVVSRLGGDEFAILAFDLDCERYATNLAQRFLDNLQQPFQIAGIELNTSASIGITFSALGYNSPDAVLRDADIAMYKAKSGGKARYALFDVGLHAEVSDRMRVEGDLRRAIADGQMSIAFQPLYALSTGRLSGFEALARWEHPELGPISPAKFIPVAEESGCMVQLTDFVLQGACRQLKAWQQSDPQFAELTMHVNIAGNDVAHSGFVSRVTQAVLENRVKPEHLTIELTENILMERLEAAIDMLNQLHHLGIGLSVDDFGTGYSSLAHLSSLPIDSLKIDRSFVQNLHPGSNESKVIRAIVLLGSSLGMEVIAEGIETPSQMEQLNDLGCDLGQGYHLSRPLTVREVDDLLAGIARTSVHAAELMRPLALH